MRKTQKQRILNSDFPTYKIGNRIYKGQKPVFDYSSGTLVKKGVPFVRVD